MESKPNSKSVKLATSLGLAFALAATSAMADSGGVKFDTTTLLAFPTNFFGANILMGTGMTKSSNANGSITLSSSGSGGSVGPGALDFAATQFATNTIVHIKSGALMTNMNFQGQGTNRGDLYVDNGVFAINFYSSTFAGDLALVSDPTGEIIESQLAVSDLEALPSRQWGSAALTNLSGNPRVATNITVLSPQSDLEVSDNGAGTWQIGKGTNFGMLHVTNFAKIGNEVSGGVLCLIAGVTNASGGITNVGIVLSNSNPALVGFQMDSPYVEFDGKGWKTTATAASQSVGMRNYFKPTQGTTTPTGSLLWMPSTNGVLGNTRSMELTTAGALMTAGGITASGGGIITTGSDFKTAGGTGEYLINGRLTIGASSDGVVYFRNSTATDFSRLTFGQGLGATNVSLFKVPKTNYLSVVSAGSESNIWFGVGTTNNTARLTVDSTLTTNSLFSLRNEGVEQAYVTTNGFVVSSATVYKPMTAVAGPSWVTNGMSAIWNSNGIATYIRSSTAGSATNTDTVLKIH